MVSTSGSELLPSSAVISFIENIFPHTYLLTPNIPEALLLLEYLGTNVPQITSVGVMSEVAKALQAHGPKNVLLKGGHSPFRKVASQYYTAENDEQKEVVVDVLVSGTEVVLIENPYINSKNTHGTGCSLACMYKCPYHEFSLTVGKPSNSVNCVQPRPRLQSRRCGALVMQLCFRSNQDVDSEPWKRKRAYQPSSQQLHPSLRAVTPPPNLLLYPSSRSC